MDQRVEMEKDFLRLEKRAEHTAIIWFDVPGEKVNTLKAGFENQFDQILTQIDQDEDIEAVVLASDKPDSFIAGADIHMLQDVEAAGEAERLSRTGQMVMNWLEAFRLPIVAAIHGPCLGGGIEVALACDGRIASHNDQTRFAQSEVKLGLIPGAGGTQRLPRLIGIEAALELVLTGKQISASRAKSLGLIDDVVHPAILIEAAAELAQQLANKPYLARKRRSGTPIKASDIKALLLEDNPVGRKVLFNQARERTLARTHGNYPAPLKAIEVIETGIEKGMQLGLSAEAGAFGELVVSHQAKRLIELFFAQNALKKENGTGDPDIEPREVSKVGVLGAGIMGSGIAYVTAAQAGLPVRLKDVDHEPVREGMRAIWDKASSQVNKGKMAASDRDQIINLIRPTTEYRGFKRVQLVIEAIFEDLELKHQVLHEMEAIDPGEFIYASNTSSLPISRIAEASQHPERVIGMHYFSPVEKIPLLEIVKTNDTAPWVIATCVALGKQQGKTVIVIRDGVGLYTTRILAPYMNEAIYILKDGVPPEVIDKALVKFGFQMGPIEVLDQVGIDVVEKVGRILEAEFGDRLATPTGIEKMLQSDRLGQKTSRGFYSYQKGDRKTDDEIYQLLDIQPQRDADHDLDVIARRCVLQMVNEAAHCYENGILRSARDGDIGAVFGLGFPPFLGGPFRYADSQGAEKVVEELEGYREVYGLRFEPAPILRAFAENGTHFYELQESEAA